MNITFFVNTAALQKYASGYPRIESAGSPVPVFTDPWGNLKSDGDEAPGLIDDQLGRVITLNADTESDKFHLDVDLQQDQLGSYNNDFVAIIMDLVNDYLRNSGDSIITLGATLAAGATSMTISDTPSPVLVNGDYLKLQDEVIKVTAGSGTGPYTITRGEFGTTDATHSSTGVPLMHIDTQINIRNNLAEDQDATLTKSMSGYLGHDGLSYEDSISSDISRILVTADPLHLHLPEYSHKFVILEASDLGSWLYLQPELDVINSAWTSGIEICQLLIGTKLSLTTMIRGYPQDLEPNTKGHLVRTSVGGQRHVMEVHRDLRRWSMQFILTEAEKQQLEFTLRVMRYSPFIMTFNYEADNPTYYWMKMISESKFTPIKACSFQASGSYWRWGCEVEEAI